MRSLPSLPGRYCPDEIAGRSGLSVLRCLATRVTAGARVSKRTGPRILRSADRWAAGRRYRAMAVPISLGSATGAGRPRRMDEPGGGDMARRLYDADRDAFWRSRQTFRD